MNPIQLKITYVDLPDVREIFADNISMVSFNDNVLRLELCVTRFDEPKPPALPTGRTYPVARLAITQTGALQLHANLTNLLATLEEQGTLKRNPPMQSAPTTPPKH
jgi:hypothetical protein